jgi:hypothetical protein
MGAIPKQTRIAKSAKTGTGVFPFLVWLDVPSCTRALVVFGASPASLVARCRQSLVASRQEHQMLDLIMLALGLSFFALSVGYTIACDRL